MSIMLDPIIEYAVEIVAAVGGLFATWALKQAADWMGVQKESEMYAWVQGQVDQALGAVEKRVKKQTDAEVPIGNQEMAQVAQTVISNSPKYLKKLGLGEEDVKRMVKERI